MQLTKWHRECILEDETAEGAILLLPTESAFSEAHVHHRDLVQEAYKKKVWLASPSTLIAMVTIARAVIKDADARNEIEAARHELKEIEEDYGALEKDIQKLMIHIDDILTISTETRKAARGIGVRINQVNGIFSLSPVDRLSLVNKIQGEAPEEGSQKQSDPH